MCEWGEEERSWGRSRVNADCTLREHFVWSKCWLLSQMFWVKLALHTFKQEPVHWGSNRCEVLHTTLKQKSKGLMLGVKGAQRIVRQGASAYALALGSLPTLHQTCHCLSSVEIILLLIFSSLRIFIWQISTKLFTDSSSVRKDKIYMSGTQ